MPQPYPPTRMTAGRQQLGTLVFDDPYDWLMESNAEVAAWQRAQAEVTGDFIRSWPHQDAVHASVAAFDDPKPNDVPRHAAGQWFWVSALEDGTRGYVLTGPTPLADGRPLLDPASLTRGAAGPVPFVSWLVPAPDGRTLAVGVCHDGSENNQITLIDVASGALLPDPPADPLMDNWTGGVQWLPDSSGFYYTALQGDRQAFQQQVLLHRRLPRPETGVVPIPWVPGRSYRAVYVAGDGGWAIAVQGLGDPIPVAVLDLRSGCADWRPFIREVAGRVAGQAHGDTYYAVTDLGAPRGRLVAIDLRAAAPGDPFQWRELAAESDAVMRYVTVIGDHLYLTELVDTYARIRRFRLDGTPAGTVPLPGRGAIGDGIFPIMNFAPKDHAGDLLFSFSTLTEGWGVYRYRTASAVTEIVREPRVNLPGATVEDRWATPADGTRIPYHVVCASGPAPAGPRPALLFAYGGYNRALVPEYGVANAVIAAAGGLFVHAHIRGGGEFGQGWWHGGRGRNKQNCYDDLFAVAEDLIAQGLTTADSLALTGLSNGGLMAGVALAQRPELWAAIVPRVPNLDLIASFGTAYLQGSTEHGDPADPEDLPTIPTRSPCHALRDGVRYPPVLVLAGDTDPRCPPWHARKFIARLQAIQPPGIPALLHVYENDGHGGATDATLRIAQYAEWLGFVMRHIGLVPCLAPGSPPPRRTEHV